MPNDEITTPRRRASPRSILAGALLALGALSLTPTARAYQPFVGEVICGGWNFCPVGWGECNGQLLSISENSALFSLIGTTYGGDGQNTLGLPNIQGRTLLGAGQGLGLSNRSQGEVGGQETVTLNPSAMPLHNHNLVANDGAERSASPVGKILGVSPASAKAYSANASNVQLRANAMSLVGGSLPHANLQPYLAVKCCIALAGIFPSQN